MSGTRINNEDAEHSLHVQLLNYQCKERLNIRIEITHLVQAKTRNKKSIAVLFLLAGGGSATLQFPNFSNSA